MRIGDAFPSKYLKASDLQGKEFTLIIKEVRMENVGDESQEDKPILYFTKAQKGLVLNRTNAQTIAANLGSDDTDQWIGKAITLFATQVDYRGQQVEAIRIRIKRPTRPSPLPEPPVELNPPGEGPDDVAF